ncbi:MAG TPA: hypothetical protein VFI96_05260, partial [Longimicrobiaceae bacterium]|nr:hypothetical protein [Longimicrobiaceae bacterium]
MPRCLPRPRGRHVPFLLLLLLAAIFLLPGRARAQVTVCKTLDPPCATNDDPPVVSVYPASQTSSISTLKVQISWSDDIGLNAGSRSITLNGASVTSSFSWSLSSDGRSATSSATVSLPSGQSTLTASVCDTGGQCSADSKLYTYTPPPPPEPHGDPRVSLAPHDTSYRDVSKGAVNVSYTTPAYVSVDAPHSVTFLYSSGQAKPRGYVQLDVSDNSETAPTKYSLELFNLDGTAVPFTRGTTELFFSAGTHEPVRIAAQFDASSRYSAAWSFNAVVTSYWGSTPYSSTTVRLRIPIVNERSSFFGFGWSMPGLQRLLDQMDGVFITEGDGTGRWFFKRSDGSYSSPDGDFSTLSWSSSGGTRTYPDGTKVFFDGAGRMSGIADRFGNATSYGYNANGSLAWIVDPANQKTTFGYTTSNTLAWVQDPMGRRVATTNAGAYLWRFFDPDGVLALDLHFDTSTERLLKAWSRGQDRNVSGSGTDYGYDAFEQLATLTLPAVVTTDAGSTRPVIRATSLEAAVLPGSGTGTSTSPRALLLSSEVRTSVTDALGNATRFALDRFREPTRIEAPLGETTMIDRNPTTGQVTGVTTPSGAQYNYDWTGPDLISYSQSGTGSGYSITYEPTYHQPTHISKGAVDVYNRYGTHGELLSTRIGADSSVYAYNTTGFWRVRTITDPKGHVVTYSYQTSGLFNTSSIANSDPAVASQSFSYDSYGRRTGVSSQGLTASTAYDVLNRPTS